MPINEQPDTTIRTTDINRAAIIIAQGLPLLDAQTNKRGGIDFVFDNTDDKAKIAAAALMNDIPVPINKFLEATRKLKEIIATHRIVVKF